MKVTKSFLDENRSNGGAWTKAQLEILGISWPPANGWISGVIGKEISEEDRIKFIDSKKTIKQIKADNKNRTALPTYINDRLGYFGSNSLTQVDLACMALEMDGFACPMDIQPEEWVRKNFSYICDEYRKIAELTKVEKISKEQKPKRKKKAKISKSKRRAARFEAAGYEIIKTAPKRVSAPVITTIGEKKSVFVSGVNVSSDEFLSAYEWRKLRMQALKLHGRRCMCCGASPETGAVMNVDHIKPRKLFPSLALDINNLQVLCHECNHGKGNWDQTDWRK